MARWFNHGLIVVKIFETGSRIEEMSDQLCLPISSLSCHHPH